MGTSRSPYARLKQIVMRVGGARLYERVAVPFAAGAFGGITLNFILTQSVSALRQFYPGLFA